MACVVCLCVCMRERMYVCVCSRADSVGAHQPCNFVGVLQGSLHDLSVVT